MAINELYVTKYGSRLENLERTIRALSVKQFETVQKKLLPHTFRSLGVLWLNQVIMYAYFGDQVDEDPSLR